MSNMYKEATKLKLRFVSLKGDLKVEDLWELPLTSRSNFDLDSIAKTVKRELDQSSQESFVTTNTPANHSIQLKMDIVKDIISDKIAERDKKAKAAENKVKRDQLTELLHQKQTDALSALTPEEIQKRIDELDQ